MVEPSERRAEDAPRPLVLAAGAFVVVGLVLRILGCLTDFWLDEVWTWEIATGLGSPLEILTAVHHSNNHHLNTLFAYLMGGDLGHWGWYRAPSVVAGLLTVAAAGWLALAHGRVAACLALILTSSSYYLVYHASEARGYAFAMLFALVGFAFLLRFMRERRNADAAAYAVCVALGFLSHLQFLHFAVGAGLWSLLRLAREDGVGWTAARDLMRLQGPGAAAALAFYAVDIRHMVIGGGPPFLLGDVLSTTAALAVGAPRVSLLPLLALVLVLGFLVWRLRVMASRGDDLWVFHLIVIVLSPAILLTAMQPDVLFPRYFMVGHVFLLLMLSETLAEGWRGSAAARGAVALALTGIIAGNGFHIAGYLESGRGTYRDALEFIVARSPLTGPIRVGSDHDFRNGKLIEFYKPFVPGGERIVYVPMEQWPGRIQWMITHSLTEQSPPAKWVEIESQRYLFTQRFPHDAHSGWDWFVFRHRAAAQGPRGVPRRRPGVRR